MFTRYGVVFLAVCIFLFAGDYNTTLVDANQSVYKNLLKTISKKRVENDEVLLQKVLLQKLININNNKIDQKKIVKIPQNETEYGNLFNLFMQYAIKKDIYASKIKQINQKIKTLKEEIKNTNKKDNTFLTLLLQDAFYNKTKALYIKQTDLIDKRMNFIAQIIEKSLENIKFDQNLFIKNIKYYKYNSDKIKNEISKLQIQRERIEFLNNKNSKIKKIDLTIKEKTDSYQKFLQKLTISLFFEFSDTLARKDKKAFSIEKKILSIVNKLRFSDAINLAIDPLLNAMEKQFLGTINVITSSTMHEFQSILATFWRIATKPYFQINGSPVSIVKLTISIFIFILGFFVGGFYRVNIKRITQNISSINSTTRNIFSNLGYYAIIIIAFILALNVLGINLSSIGLVAGALSVGIGFGLQNIVSNFISGIILMFERSIKIGDYIELSNELRGHVTGINMRSTTINTNSNIDVIVPNQNFIQNNVINWTMNDEIRRFQIPFGVAYGTKPEKVIDVIKEALKKSGFRDIIETPARHSRIIMVNMGSSSVDFELFVWLKGGEILYPKRTISRFLILVYNALYENHIEIPFPQQDLHIRSIGESVQFSLKEK